MAHCINLLEAIEATYDVAARPDTLPRALGAIGSYLEIRGLHLITLEPRGASFWSIAEQDAAERARYSPAWGHTELSHGLLRAQPGRVFSLRAFWRDLKGASSLDAVPLPWEDCAAALVPSFERTRQAVLLAPLHDASQDQRRQVMEKLTTLLPHLARAITLVQRWNEPVASITAASELLRDLPMACVLTDSAGRCIESNNAFRLLAEPLSIQVLGGRVRFTDTYLQDSWQSALTETAQTAVARALLAVSGRGRQWKVHLLPVRCHPGDGRESQNLIMAVYEEQSGGPVADPERFASVGKLTPAELDVLSGLLQGYTGKVIARSRGASVNTVRSQIMSILSKTGHRSQKELIAAFGASSFDPSSLDTTY